MNRKTLKKHFIFDLYGTLVDIHTDEDRLSFWEAMAAYFKENGAVFSPKELEEAFREATATDACAVSAASPEILYPEADMVRVFSALYRSKGIYADWEMCIRTGRHFREKSTEYIRLYKGVPELLNNLKKIGKLWILSNAQELFTMPELEKLGLLSYFDGIFISSQYGCKKPDPMFFMYLLKGNGISAGEAVMIGNDGISDIRGAKNLGISTVYLHSNLSPDEPLPAADIVLEIDEIDRLFGLLALET